MWYRRLTVNGYCFLDKFYLNVIKVEIVEFAMKNWIIRCLYYLDVHLIVWHVFPCNCLCSVIGYLFVSFQNILKWCMTFYYFNMRTCNAAACNLETQQPIWLFIWFCKLDQSVFLIAFNIVQILSRHLIRIIHSYLDFVYLFCFHNLLLSE